MINVFGADDRAQYVFCYRVAAGSHSLKALLFAMIETQMTFRRRILSVSNVSTIPE